MTRENSNGLGSVLRTTLAAAAVTLITLPAAFASDAQSGLERFLATPASFTAIAEGAPGPVTFASMAGNTLAVQFRIPTHGGDTFGEFVGKADATGAFVGNGMLIKANGGARSVPVTLTFQDDGTILADTANGGEQSGFMPNEMFHGY